MDFAQILLNSFLFFCSIFPPNSVNAGTANNNNCPQGQSFFGPCVANQCPSTCPGICACFGPANQDCCSTVNGGQNGGNNANNGLLTRLLLALLLSSPGPIRLPIPVPSPVQLGLVICRDLALNCAFYFPLYCNLPAYALCMRTHCAATCGLCNEGLGLGPLLLSLLGLRDGGGGNGGILAVRAGSPPIKTTVENEATNHGNGTLFGPKLVMKSGKGGNGQRNMSDNNPTEPDGGRMAAANAPPIQFAIPPGLVIPEKIRQKMAAISRRLNGG